MRRFAQLPTFGWCLLLGLLLACMAMGIFAVLRPPRNVPSVILRQPIKMPVSLRDRLGRWIPRTRGWAWAWAVEQAVFGKRKPVDFCAELVSLADASGASPASFSLGPPRLSDTNGLQVWLLRADQLKALREHFKQTPGMCTLCRPRISTANGSEAQLFAGESLSVGGVTQNVGVALGCWARVHSASSDLITCVRFSELVTNDAIASGGSSLASVVSVQTNLDVALRLQIPKGQGVLLLNAPPKNSAYQHICVLIDPLQPKPGS
jgi:hypothetical protein